MKLAVSIYNGVVALWVAAIVVADLCHGKTDYPLGVWSGLWIGVSLMISASWWREARVRRAQRVEIPVCQAREPGQVARITAEELAARRGPTSRTGGE